MPVTEPVHRVHPLAHLRLHPLQLLDRVQDALPHRSTVEVTFVEQLVSALAHTTLLSVGTQSVNLQGRELVPCSNAWKAILPPSILKKPHPRKPSGSAARPQMPHSPSSKMFSGMQTISCGRKVTSKHLADRQPSLYRLSRHLVVDGPLCVNPAISCASPRLNASTHAAMSSRGRTVSRAPYVRSSCIVDQGGTRRSPGRICRPHHTRIQGFLPALPFPEGCCRGRSRWEVLERSRVDFDPLRQHFTRRASARAFHALKSSKCSC